MAEKIGFLQDDRILSINGKPVTSWNELEGTVFIEQMSDNVSIEVERSGNKMFLTIPKNSIKETETSFLFNPKYVLAKVAYVEPNSPAHKAGLTENDIFIKIKGMPATSGSEVTKTIQSNAGTEIPFEIKRKDQILSINVTPDANTKMIGVRILTEYTGPKDEISMGIFRSFGAGVSTAYKNTYLFLESLWHIITGKIEFSKAVGGPVKIAKFANQTAELGIVPFLSFIAMLSLTLAIINILPFPALDGGHLVFLIYEGIFRKEVPVKARLFLQQIGFGLLMLFMVFVIYNDIFR
jgi:regulator of sigma E protease